MAACIVGMRRAGTLTVTRELKLALIVGFALVLVVTVLISDHMSRARTTRLADSRADQPFSTREISPAGGPTRFDRTPTPTGPLVANASTAPSDVTSVAHEGLGAAAAELRPPTLTLGAGGGMNPPGTGTLEETAAKFGVKLNNVPVAMEPSSVANTPPGMESLSPLPNSTPGGGTAQPNTNPYASPVPGGVYEGQNSFPAAVPNSGINTGPGTGSGTGVIPGPLSPIITPESTLPTVLPVASSKSEEGVYYTVVSGDSLYKIATKQLGNAEAWRQIAKANGLSESTSLKIGQKLRMPAMAQGGRPQPASQPRATVRQSPERVDPAYAIQVPRQSTRPVVEPKPVRREARPEARPEAKPEPRSDGKTYVVQKGDTIMTIAQKALGSARRADDILAINDEVDSDNIHVGQVLKLPPR